MSEHNITVDAIAPRVEPFLKNISSRAGLELDFEVVPGEHTHPDFEDPEVVVRFSGPDVDLLLANRAELLLALEQLTMEVLQMRSEDHSRLCFDANDYRVLRIEELRMSALTAAERVKQTGKPFHFSPMSSRERRIIHMSLRNEKEVKSLSTGMGPLRQVVVMPADMQTVPEPVRPPAPRHDDGPRRGGRDDRFRDSSRGRDRGRDRRPR